MTVPGLLAWLNLRLGKLHRRLTYRPERAYMRGR